MSSLSGKKKKLFRKILSLIKDVCFGVHWWISSALDLGPKMNGHINSTNTTKIAKIHWVLIRATVRSTCYKSQHFQQCTPATLHKCHKCTTLFSCSIYIADMSILTKVGVGREECTRNSGQWGSEKRRKRYSACVTGV